MCSYSMTKKRTVLLLAFLLIGTILLLNYKTKDLLSKYYTSTPYFLNWTFSDVISCHYVIEGDALPSIEELDPPPQDSIFFHETSCKGGLNSRQACSVESAARIHPHRTVHVFFNSPVSDLVLSRSCLAKLLQFKNVRLARLHTAEYAKGTALADMLAHRENNHSNWRIEHTADMLRYITMYKYGGLYLDTDMLVVKALGPLGDNWVAREDESLINVAAFAIDRNGVGHEIVSQILEDIKSDYRPTEWVYNGPGAMNRGLLKFCNATDILDLTAEMCHGFNIYNPSKIYPVHWSDMDTYFQPGDLPEETETAYMHHLWNRLSRNDHVDVDSPYDKLSRKYCPTVREMYGDKFGS